MAPRSLLGDWRDLLLGLVNMSSHPEAPWPTYYRILAPEFTGLGILLSISQLSSSSVCGVQACVTRGPNHDEHQSEGGRDRPGAAVEA